MMNRTHTTCGAAAGAWLGVAVHPEPWLALTGVGLAALAARIPDVDHLDAAPVRAWELFRWRCKGLRVFSWTLIPKLTFRFGIGPLASWLLRAVSHFATGRKHRGLTHSLIFAVGLSLAAGVAVGQWTSIETAVFVGTSILVGMVAALLGDLVTNSGLKYLLWPSRAVVSVPRGLRIGTGGIVELYVVFPLMLVATWAGIALLVLGG